MNLIGYKPWAYIPINTVRLYIWPSMEQPLVVALAFGGLLEKLWVSRWVSSANLRDSREKVGGVASPTS